MKKVLLLILVFPLLAVAQIDQRPFGDDSQMFGLRENNQSYNITITEPKRREVNYEWLHPKEHEYYPYDGQPYGGVYTSDPCPHCGHTEHRYVDAKLAWCTTCNHNCQDESIGVPVGNSMIVVFLFLLVVALRRMFKTAPSTKTLTANSTNDKES